MVRNTRALSETVAEGRRTARRQRASLSRIPLRRGGANCPTPWGDSLQSAAAWWGVSPHSPGASMCSPRGRVSECLLNETSFVGFSEFGPRAGRLSKSQPSYGTRFACGLRRGLLTTSRQSTGRDVSRTNPGDHEDASQSARSSAAGLHDPGLPARGPGGRFGLSSDQCHLGWRRRRQPLEHRRQLGG